MESKDRLKEAIAALKEHTSREMLQQVIDILKETSIWIPCTAVTEEEDDRKVKKMIEEAGEHPERLIGQEYVSDEGIRIIPKFIQGGQHMYIPVFSSTGEMIEDESTSEVEASIYDAVALAVNCDQKLRGIVVNPFTQAFIMDAEILKEFEEESPLAN